MAHSSSHPPGHPLIVVVEGDEGVRSDLTHTLEVDGCRVLPAGDCRTAILLVTGADLPVDLIITDISVTYLEGHDLLEKLARLQRNPPVLFISTHPSPTATGVTAEPTTPQPITPGVLRSTVHRLLGLDQAETRASEETA
jgi:DNA-binding NtrC family response regulator